MPTGVSVSSTGRLFVCFPRLGDPVKRTVVELVPRPNGVGRRAVAYPDKEINRLDVSAASTHFVSVQSVVVDARDRLWALDTGIPVPNGQPVPGGAKLVAFDLNTNAVVQTVVFPADLIGATSFLNDVRFDLTRGRAGVAYVTDASTQGPSGLIVVDLASGNAVRRLAGQASVVGDPQFRAVVEGEQVVERPDPESAPARVRNGTDGIALSADGRTLYYRPLASRRLYAVDTAALSDFSRSDDQVGATVRDLGEIGLNDGLETDSQNRVYLTNVENNAVRRFDPEAGENGTGFNGTFETLSHNRHLTWPDTFSLGADGSLYVTTSQFNRMARYNGGVDKRERPFLLLRIPTDAAPARR